MTWHNVTVTAESEAAEAAGQDRKARNRLQQQNYMSPHSQLAHRFPQSDPGGSDEKERSRKWVINHMKIQDRTDDPGNPEVWLRHVAVMPPLVSPLGAGTGLQPHP